MLHKAMRRSIATVLSFISKRLINLSVIKSGFDAGQAWLMFIRDTKLNLLTRERKMNRYELDQ